MSFFTGSLLKNHKAVIFPSLGFESLDHSNNVLTTNWTLGHLFSTVSAGTHMTTLQHHTVNLQTEQFSKVLPRFLPTTYRRVHANLAEGLVFHGLDIIFVHLLLLPKSLEDFQQFIFLDTAFEVDSVHGQHFLYLLCAQLLQILLGLDLGEIN